MAGPIQRIRHDADTVLDQVMVRNYVYNPDTLLWEASTSNDLLTDILAKLEQIRIQLGGSP